VCISVYSNAMLYIMVCMDTAGLPVFHHVLTPRSKGLWLCTERLRACTTAFYDVTIAYSSTLKSTSNDNLTVHAAAPSLRGMLVSQLCILVVISSLVIVKLDIAISCEIFAVVQYISKNFSVT